MAETKKDGPIPLLTPFKLGNFQLSHRVVLAPLTRCRSTNHVPQEWAIKYYSDRASPGGLLFTEGTVVSPQGHGYPITPGLYTNEQVEAWKPIVKAVHDKGGIFFAQIWHVGRKSHGDYQPDHGAPVSGSSKKVSGQIMVPDYTMKDYPEPHQLTIDEIPKVIQEFATAATNAIEAGFDGVEIHGAHGYLLEQFTKDSVNDRTDKYGTQNFENRTRFVLELIDAVCAAVGADKVGIRFSPFATYGDAKTSDPVKLGLALLEEVSKKNILYVHFVEPRVSGTEDVETEDSLRAFRIAYNGNFLAAGGFDRTRGNRAIERNDADLIVYGRLFLANPDLPKRFELNAPLNKHIRDTFYTPDPVVGYNDYPFLDATAVNS